MQKLDRLGWAAGVCFTAFGRSIGIRVNTPEVPADVLDPIVADYEKRFFSGIDRDRIQTLIDVLDAIRHSEP